MTVEWTDLIQAARNARDNAYCPYSGYSVGAAVGNGDGEVFTGVNVENISYGATICAERSAIVAMVATGSKKLTRIAVATSDGGPPCGMCLQVMAEFADPNLEIALIDRDGVVKTHHLRDFLPLRFESAEVKRKDEAS